MSRRFRCGRLKLTKDGHIKKVDLSDGGGLRLCNWDPIDMDFRDVHQRLLNIYDLQNVKHNTSLYDFQRSLLNIHQYKTFSEYMEKNGLNCNSTTIYLCLCDNDDHPVERKNTIQSLISTRLDEKSFEKKEEMIPLQRSIEMGIIPLPRSIEREIIPLRRSIETESIAEKKEEIRKLLSEYSYKQSIENLIKDVRLLLSRIDFDEIFLQLLEDFSKISSSIDLLNEILKDDSQSMEKLQIKLLMKNFSSIADVCQSTTKFLKSNQAKFVHLEAYSIMISKFYRFDRNFKNLYNHWLRDEKMDQRTSSIVSTEQSTQRNTTESVSSSTVFKPLSSSRSSTISKPLSSSRPSPSRSPTTVKSLSPSRSSTTSKPLSSSRSPSTVKPLSSSRPSRSRSPPTVEPLLPSRSSTTSKPLSSSRSSRSPTTVKSLLPSQSSTAPKALSSSRSSINEEKNEIALQFDSLLKHSIELSEILRGHQFLAIDDMLKPLIEKLQSQQLNFKLIDHQWMLTIQQMISSIHYRMTRVTSKKGFKGINYEMVATIFDQIFQILDSLPKSLHHSQSQAGQHNRTSNFNWSSLPLPIINQQPVENRSSNKRNLPADQSTINQHEQDDDRNSNCSSHSVLIIKEQPNEKRLSNKRKLSIDQSTTKRHRKDDDRNSIEPCSSPEYERLLKTAQLFCQLRSF